MWADTKEVNAELNTSNQVSFISTLRANSTEPVDIGSRLRGQTILIISIYLITLWTSGLRQSLLCNQRNPSRGEYFNALRFSHFGGVGKLILFSRNVEFSLFCEKRNSIKALFAHNSVIGWCCCCVLSRRGEIEFGNWRLFNFLQRNFFNFSLVSTTRCKMQNAWKSNEIQFNFHNSQAFDSFFSRKFN